MNEYDNFGKDVEITISLNDIMKILKVYDDNVDKIPCHVDDELYYPSLTCACISMVMKARLNKSKNEADDVINETLQKMGINSTIESISEELT